MKPGLIFSVLIVLAFSASTLLAQPQQGGQRERRNIGNERQLQRENRWGMESISGQYSMLIKEIKLTNDQKKKLKKEFDLYQQDSQSLRDDAREQLRADQPEENRKQALTNFNIQWEKITGDHNAAINAILTPEQREAWQNLRLSGLIRQKLTAIELTSEQDEQISKLIAAAAAEIARIDGKNTKVFTAAQGKLIKDIMMTVLNDEQVSRLLIPAQTPLTFGWGRGDWAGPTRG